MKVVIMDKTTFGIISIHSVTSITWANNITTVVGINDAGDGSVFTFTANSNRYIVRILEN